MIVDPRPSQSNTTLRLGIALLATILPGAARACDASIAGIGATPVAQYDPFSGNVGTESMTIDLRIAGDPAQCTLGLSVANVIPGNARTMMLGTSSLLYRLFTRDGVELANDRSATVALPPPEGSNPLYSLRIEVPAGQMGPAGTYDDPVTLRLIDLGDGGKQLGGDVEARITAAVESRAQVNIAGTTGSIGAAGFGVSRLDFGRIVTGSERSAIVQVRSTAPVILRVHSDNRGMMRRTAGAAEQLAYEARLDGEEISLSDDASLARNPPPTVAGASYPILVRITGDPDLLPAGDYRDLLTIDVLPQ